MKNLMKNNNLNYREIFNMKEYNEQNTTDRGTKKKPTIINKIRLNKFKAYFCVLCIRNSKNLQNILLEEGMNIIIEKLDILHIFRKILKDDMNNEKLEKIEVIGMSDKCKQNLENIKIFSNINS